MIRVVCPSGKEVAIRWRHAQTEGPRVARRTECEVTIVFTASRTWNLSVLYDGVAECSARDQFSRKVGRKLSLARALKKAPLDKADRLAIWRAIGVAP